MMISSISSHIPSGDIMAQAVSEHQNHDRPQDIKAHSQGTSDALNDFNALQSMFIFFIKQMMIKQMNKHAEDKLKNVMHGNSQKEGAMFLKRV